MADASDITTVAYIFKRRYSDKQVTEVAMREHPTYYEIPKRSGLTGSGFFYPTTTGNPQGISSGSSGLATAQSAAETLKGVQFVMQPVLKYGVLTIDGPSISRARGNKAAFYDLVTRHVDGMTEELGANCAFDVQRSGNGLRGRRASISGNVVTLTSKRDVENFKRGMTVIASANANGSSPRSGSAKVVSLDRANKKITLDDAATILLFADSDYLFRKGDPSNCMEGMESATPLSAPTSGDSFRGIDRSVDVEALAGSRIDNVSLYPEEAIGDLAVETGIIGKKITRASIYPVHFQSIVKRTGAQVQYTNPGGSADIGFESLIIHTAGGAVRVVSDPDVPTDRIRVYRPDAHCIMYTDDEMIHVIRDDGKPSQRSSTTDGLEFRFRFQGNYLQEDQASHGVASQTAL